MTKQTLNWIEDPGHGWLIITPEDLASAGLTEDDISPHSYRSQELIALEEDCDALAYIKARYGEVPYDSFDHRNTYVETGGPRTWPSFGKKVLQMADQL